MLDFAALPPEINSARMYSGPGSGPMLAAAAAWTMMAAEMRSAAAGYGSVVSELTSGGWLGPSSMSMSAAAAPYLAWLSTTATQAEQAGIQANAAAAAYESAFAMTVPPPVIAANRTQLATLVATNVFGQNTPAIAATEAQYAEMWAQDAAAMNGYAAASNSAAQVTPFTSPGTNTTPDAVTGQNQAVTQAVNTSAGNTQSLLSANTLSANDVSAAADPTAGSATDYLTGLLDGSNNTALGSFLQSNFLSGSVLNGTIAGGPFNPQSILATAVGAMGTRATTLAGLDDFTAGAEATASAGSLASNTVGSAGLTGASAGVGNAHLVGSLSVPQGWSSAATISQAQTATPVGGLSDIGTSGAPAAGGPGGVAGPMGGTGRRLRRAIPRYGFRPVVMPRPPAAG
ncbi:PPE family protein [Mycobacterium vulneris]|jgi:PPE-repeat protein|uniref:PPE family protein n=1 Tax=Mycolicibacterium vulneris TaxID=547163 RepID=A0A1X2KTH5_9MYCO|nr:PPE family protein [Mycolicibacterium vulneris]OSC24972.1 PPE family protein [Mycolicibacterium vulneris]